MGKMIHNGKNESQWEKINSLPLNKKNQHPQYH